MRLLGIILLVLNLLLTAAIALYLAPQSWGKRQTLNASVAKAYLLKSGLPVNGDNYDSGSSSHKLSFETANMHRVETVSKEFIESYFGTTDGYPPVLNQADEILRAYTSYNTSLTNLGENEVLYQLAGSFDAKNQYTPGVLALMVSSYEEREKVRELIPRGASKNDQGLIKKGVDEAKKMFNAEYLKATTATSEIEKKQRIAHFLAFMNPHSNTWQKRVIQVTGFHQYVETVSQHTSLVEGFKRVVTRKIEQDQDSFFQEYELLRRLAVNAKQLYVREKEVEDSTTDNNKLDSSNNNSQLSQKAERIKELETLNKSVADRMLANEALEKELQLLQQKVATLLDNISTSESNLEQAEKKR